MKKRGKGKVGKIRMIKEENLHKLHNPWDCERLCHKYTNGCHCPSIVRPLCDFGSRKAGKEKVN